MKASLKDIHMTSGSVFSQQTAEYSKGMHILTTERRGQNHQQGSLLCPGPTTGRIHLILRGGQAQTVRGTFTAHQLSYRKGNHFSQLHNFCVC